MRRAGIAGLRSRCKKEQVDNEVREDRRGNDDGNSVHAPESTITELGETMGNPLENSAKEEVAIRGQEFAAVPETRKLWPAGHPLSSGQRLQSGRWARQRRRPCLISEMWNAYISSGCRMASRMSCACSALAPAGTRPRR